MNQSVEDLLRQTSAAHGVYEETELNGIYDQEWAAWYAAWALEHGLNDLLDSNMNADRLAALLVEINDVHQQANSGENWAQFTARWLVEKYQG
jgi:hypothetical protein